MFWLPVRCFPLAGSAASRCVPFTPCLLLHHHPQCGAQKNCSLVEGGRIAFPTRVTAALTSAS